MSSIVINYKEFIKSPSIIFNYDHSKIKFGNCAYKSENYIQLGYLKDKEYDDFIIEATNDDIFYFITESYQDYDEHDPYLVLNNYDSILYKIKTIIINKMKEINIKNHYYKSISYNIVNIDQYNLYSGNKMVKDIPIIYYETNKSSGINLKNINSDLLNILVNNNKVKIQLKLTCKMIIPWDSYTDNLIELYMNIINIKIYKNSDYDDSILIKNKIINNTIDFNNSIYNFDNIMDKLKDNTFNFQKSVINILKYFDIKYDLNVDYNYTLTRYYVIGEDTYFTNMTIIFDERFKNYDITEKIKQEFSNVVQSEYCMNDIFFVEKEKNKKYVLVYSNDYRYGYGGNEINEIFLLYSSILKILTNICDINNCIVKLDDTNITKQNKYNIINRTLNNYIYQDYSTVNNKILNEVFETVIMKKYDDFDYNYVNAYIKFNNGVICFENKELKDEFDTKLKELMKE